MGSSEFRIQQALTEDAETVVKLAMNLARRRGHAEVVPLHVAIAMLSSSCSQGLFREACLESVSGHPLQCRALELCFNVALNNNVPTSTSSFPNDPFISNSLVAAFERARAQAHQQQEQVNIELEHLVVSIIDDPCVSMSMSEAGFCSSFIKSKVQQPMPAAP